MKKILVSFFFLFVTVSVLFAQFQQFSTGAEMCSHRKQLNEQLVEKSLRSANSPKHSFDVQKYSINIDLVNCFTSPYPNSFKADVRILFKVDSTLNHIVLNANSSSLVIDSVRSNGSSFIHSGHQLTIQLDRTYEPGEIVEVHIYYRHANVVDGAFYASDGFVFTDCEPEGARKWLPCYDRPSDKALTDILVKVPENAKIGSNGNLKDSIIDGNTISYHWISRDPVATYLIVLSGKNNYKLDIVNWTNPNTSEEIPFRFYYNAGEDPSYIKNIIGSMCSFYSQKFGDHPFEKNGFATLNNEFAWGGMENQTLTSLCPDCWSESLIAHEFAHQWFGDMITCATWADIFLNEGFATWTEANWTENQHGYIAYHNELKGNANYYLSYNPHWAISVPSWAITTPGVNTLFNYAITYMKGSCVLHMLRYTMGDDSFFSAMKAYATDTTDFKYRSATIADFKNKMELESGLELDWFFDQWIYKPDHPVYENVYTLYPENETTWIAKFRAHQVEKPFLPYFQMPLELLIDFADGSDTLVKVFNSYNDQYFSFSFPNEPVLVTFDPNNNILLKEGTTVVGLDELLEAKSVFALKVSPNPFKNKVGVNWNQPMPSNVQCEIYNSNGSVVKSTVESFMPAGENSIDFQLEGLKAGTYFVVLRIAGNTESASMIKTE